MAAAIATLDVCEGDSRLSSDNATMPRKSAVEQLHFFFVFLAFFAGIGGAGRSSPG